MAKKQAFKNADAEFAKAFNKCDPKALAELHARDALHLPSNGSIVKGRKAIGAAFAEMFRSGLHKVKFKSLRSGSAGDIAYNVGTFSGEIETASGAQKAKGKFVDIYRRDADGSWKIAVTINNSDLPA
jgi:uncharacterized protein (TIGR02246 family)